MKVVFLGTNGWYDSNTGNTICTFIETDNYYIVLDAGNGIFKLDQHIKSDKKPIYLFLSHFHLDHIEGLHILSKFRFKQGIHIYGQKGTIESLNKVINKPFTVNFEDLIMNVHIHELDEGVHTINNGGSIEKVSKDKSITEHTILIACKFLIHASPCLGYRIQTDDKIITYGTDTGICPELIELAEDADLLITECSFKMGQKNEKWPHLNPEDAVKIANKSKAKKLALTHFDANVYRKIEERAEIKEEMKSKFNNIYVGYDNLEIEVK